MAALSGNYNVCVKMSELKDRNRQVLQMLVPLVDKPHDLFVNNRVSVNDFVWAAQQRGGMPSDDHTNWKFKTTVKDIYASYYERWTRFFDDREEKWYLDRAYLHFYQIDRVARASIEYLLLHCDPNETREHANYKRSPHIHIVVGPDPFPHAHIALNLNYLEPMLTDASTLTAAFSSAIVMLKEQIIDHLD